MTVGYRNFFTLNLQLYSGNFCKHACLVTNLDNNDVLKFVLAVNSYTTFCIFGIKDITAALLNSCSNSYRAICPRRVTKHFLKY
jgi:hypothetical protein